MQPTWCCPTDQSGVLLQAFGNLLPQVSSCSLLRNTMALNKYPHTHSFSSFTLTVASSLASCRDCPGVANAAHLLPLVEILASNTSFGCNFPTHTRSSLPSLRCLEMQLCCLPIHVRPPLKVLQGFISCSFVACSAHYTSSPLASISSQDSLFATLDFHASSHKKCVGRLPGCSQSLALDTGKGDSLSAGVKCRAAALVILSNPI